MTTTSPEDRAWALAPGPSGRPAPLTPAPPPPPRPLTRHAGHHVGPAALVLALRDQWREVAVAGDDHERVDVLLAPAQVHGVHHQPDVRGVLAGGLAPRDLDQLDAVLVQALGVAAEPVPVGIRHLDDDLALLQQPVEDAPHLEGGAGIPQAQCDVLEVDEHGDLQLRTGGGWG